MALSRIKWDREEDRALLEFILDELHSGNELATTAKGYGIWKLAQQQEVTPHSANSMQTRWRKVIVPGLRSNDKEICEALSPVDILYLQNHFCKSPKPKSKKASQKESVEKRQVSSSDEEEEEKESEGTPSRKRKRTHRHTPSPSDGEEVVDLEKTPVKEKDKKTEKEEKHKEESTAKQKKGNPSKKKLVDVFYEPDQGEEFTLEQIAHDIPAEDISREDLEMEIGELSDSELEANYIPLDIPSRFSKRFKAIMIRKASTLESGDLQLVRRQYRVVDELALQYRTPYRIVLELARDLKNFQQVGQRLLERRKSILHYRSRKMRQLLADLPDCQI